MKKPFRRTSLDDDLINNHPDHFLKYTIPCTEALALMRQLRADGISSDTVFPGYGGVVQSTWEGLDLEENDVF